MADELIAHLARLSVDEAFRLLYGAYQHLPTLPDEVRSSTRLLLRRIQAGEVDAVLYCVGKMLEEQDEVRLVLAGSHRHEGQSPRDTLVNEVQQSIYWPLLLAIGRGVEYDAVRLAEFLRAGLEGREPDKQQFEDGQTNEVGILRRALVLAGRAVAEWNRRGSPVAPHDIPLTDLRQMAGKEYLRPVLLTGLGEEPAQGGGV